MPDPSLTPASPEITSHSVDGRPVEWYHSDCWGQPCAGHEGFVAYADLQEGK